MDKFAIRNQVRNAVETLFTFSLERKEVAIYNLTLKLDYCDEDGDNLTESWIEVRKLIYGKYELLETFYIERYAGNNWDLVTEPWVCDLINDITDLVMIHIEEPKKKGW